MQAFNLLALAVVLSISFTISAQTNVTSESDVKNFLNAGDIETCITTFESEIEQAEAAGDSTTVGQILVRFNPCFMGSKKYKQYHQNALRALTVLDSTQHTEAYYQALKNVLNYHSFFDPPKVLGTMERVTEYSKSYMSRSIYLEVKRGYLNVLLRNNAYEKLEEEAYGLMEESDLNADYIIAHNILANASMDSDPSRADSLYRLGIARDTAGVKKRSISAIHRDYGNFLNGRGQSRKAIDYLIEALSYIPDQRDFQLNRIHIMNTIAQLFNGLDQNQRALEYSNQALAIAEQNQFKTQNGLLTIVNGQILNDIGQTENAIKQFQKASTYLNTKKKPELLLNCLSILGETFVKQKQLSKAQEIENEIQALKETQAFDFDNRYYYGFTARLAEAGGEYVKASSTYKKMLKQSLDNQRPKQQLYALKGLARNASQQSRYKEALDYNMSYHALNDSLFQSKQNYEINILESEYNRKEQDSKIALFDKEREIQALKLNQQQRFLTYSIIGLAALSLFIFFLFRLMNRLRKQKGIIEKALHDKDVLLKEIHHRVKNNLQLVSSLLTLQGRSIDNEQALQAINEGKSRVRSMALIHQDLYVGENLTGVNAKAYLEKLTSELFSTYNVDSESVKLKLDIEDVDIDIDTIVPLGLIINELVTNSLKYAFPENRSGVLQVSLVNSPDGLVLNVADNGIGMKQSFTNSKSFGNKLVSTLIEQLEGKMTIDYADGIKTNILFKSYKMAS